MMNDSDGYRNSRISRSLVFNNDVGDANKHGKLLWHRVVSSFSIFPPTIIDVGKGMPPGLVSITMEL